jgi:6-pyruvoyltetrahydropterin/6-carboxytetrahydropterin synthase
MYTLAVKRTFIARHFLIGGDWGPENFPNSHQYTLELQLTGATLDQHGYMVDIVDVEKHLDETVAYYKEQMLNDLPEFAGLNPSIEHFARILAEQLNAKISAPNVTRLQVRVWENDIAWVSYQLSR